MCHKRVQSLHWYFQQLKSRNWLKKTERSRQKDPDGMSDMNGIILVTEDNSDVRLTTCMMLKKLGWTVLEAEDGAQALEVLRSRSDIDILLSDVVMPGGRSGYDLARELSEDADAPRVLLVSGYPDEFRSGNEASGLVVPLLEKPFTMSQLREALADLMKDI
jgi:CheY-like chemotaxis protein